MPRLDRGSRSLSPCFLPINIGDREKKQKNEENRERKKKNRENKTEE
jgi:hypothetical protein